MRGWTDQNGDDIKITFNQGDLRSLNFLNASESTNSHSESKQFGKYMHPSVKNFQDIYIFFTLNMSGELL